jgi:hypothetical protein
VFREASTLQSRMAEESQLQRTTSVSRDAIEQESMRQESERLRQVIFGVCMSSDRFCQLYSSLFCQLTLQLILSTCGYRVF